MPGPRICTSFAPTSGEGRPRGCPAHTFTCAGQTKYPLLHSSYWQRALSASSQWLSQHLSLLQRVGEPGATLSLSLVRASSCGLNWQRSTPLAWKAMVVLSLEQRRAQAHAPRWADSCASRLKLSSNPFLRLQLQLIPSLIVLNSSP